MSFVSRPPSRCATSGPHTSQSVSAWELSLAPRKLQELEQLRKESEDCQVLRQDAERVARERRDEQAQLQSCRKEAQRVAEEHAQLQREHKAAGEKHAQLQREHKAAGEEHAQLKDAHEAAVGELERLRSIILEGSHVAQERTTSLTSNVLKIQFRIRRFFKQQRQKRVAAEQARHEKHRKVVSAMILLQYRWRLRSQERKRRWQVQDHGATQYDAILAFDSLAEFQEKKQIQFLQRAESHLQVAKKNRYRIVAVVGLFDKGKTWLLNKLFGVAWWQFGFFGCYCALDLC